MTRLRSVKPIATCAAESCQDCPLEGVVHCHFRLRDLAGFLGAALPSFAVGIAGIRHQNPELLVPWVILIVAVFGLLEVRVLCTHCPHYAEPGFSLRCWANYGSPKLWRFRPGPLSGFEKTVLLGGAAAVWGYPVVIMGSGTLWWWMCAYAAATGAFYLILRRAFCTRCMNLECPLNSVPAGFREAFIHRNPRSTRS